MAGTLYDHGELDQFIGSWAQRYLPPIAGQLDLVEGEEGEEIVPGIFALPAPEHTTHHMALIIASGDELLNLVDVAINPLHLAQPEWHPAFDWDPRRRSPRGGAVVDAPTMARVLVYHFPFPGIGRVRRAGSGWEWEPQP